MAVRNTIILRISLAPLAVRHHLDCTNHFPYFRSKKFNVRLYTCNYGESGNILRRRVYKVGGACSDCPCGTACSDTLPGLCSTHARNSTNTNLMCVLDPRRTQQALRWRSVPALSPLLVITQLPVPTL